MSTNLQMTRNESIEKAVDVLNSKLFVALQEPARLSILKEVIKLGTADIGQISSHLPQERSVISRHLKVLHEAEILTLERVGRHHFYSVNGTFLIQEFEQILNSIKQIQHICCK